MPNNSDRDFSASQSEDDIHADIAELFASQPPEWDDFFADPIVRTRICAPIRSITTKPALTCRYAKTRRFLVPSKPAATS
jgi:hypothetical protein